ncbi:DUF2075 domain-containing protein [Vibrio europaeus]|uniref:DUF2075 domain-containing protein n=1 Tax=Vibrio europaeus TaxID=300876 RepID=A0ABT5GUW0_9VIBR|nr:DNA/RNA helicase domain-containing protein [Vibrio europaeus]MDC5703457.1 DUF2075 domain-containing protein [Vibrio europaeus]MDC5711388.1 DUF2075 domain-containing protein [Vibrio europaeus]MDC5714881.1 DUF2075 domain-containing protein [Vibrio europaeus]MDC5727499.1 DUF2075 domain-containing protein [Vibrio europaeus]MDC5729724.1 DUF2075 domain-containing protein [Vibrio europaeus]
MDVLAGWSGTWEDFFNTEELQLLDVLTTFHTKLPWTKELSPSQRYAWEVEYAVMQKSLRFVCEQADLNPQEAWIAFEQELVGEGGKRAADVNVILPSGDLFVIEFKHKRSASEHEIWRALFDLKTMQRFHSESINLRGHSFLALTDSSAVPFDSNNVTCDIPDNGVLNRLTNSILISLSQPHQQYDTHQWQYGEFYRQPSILHGTVQVFFEETIPTLKTSAGENIEQARANLAKLYEHAKSNQKRYVVVVHGRPGAGKTLLGISAVADLVHKFGAENCQPIFLSGNGPLVQVLQETIEYHGKRKEHDDPFDGRVMIEALINFKRTLRHTNREENFVVFDEAQRAWERVNPRSSNSESELHLLCNWLAQKEFGVLVLLVGDGQAIYNNEMSLDKMLLALEDAVLRNGNRISAIMPTLHAHHITRVPVAKRDAFYLKTPIRQAYTQELDAWIEAVLNGDAAGANTVSQTLCLEYPLFVTQSKRAADKYARELQQTLHEDNKKADAFRMGWLMSSSGGPFIEEVITNKKKPGKYVGPWYVESPASPNSCCQLDAACTEFASQGLELSLALFNWGQDLLFRDNSLRFFKRPGCKRSQEHYTTGSYRVLLSRGRNGLIIKCDDTGTFQYLQDCGMRVLDYCQ